MLKSKFIINKFAKLLEHGMISYKDLSTEILNIIRSKRDEIVFKLKLAGKEEVEVVNKRLEKLERKIENLEKKKIKKVKKS